MAYRARDLFHDLALFSLRPPSRFFIVTPPSPLFYATPSLRSGRSQSWVNRPTALGRLWRLRVLPLAPRTEPAMFIS
jgi:hypothetical protein